MIDAQLSSEIAKAKIEEVLGTGAQAVVTFGIAGINFFGAKSKGEKVH